MLEYYQGWNHGMVKIPHGNMSLEDLSRMTKMTCLTCPCYTIVHKFRGRSQRTYGLTKKLEDLCMHERLCFMPKLYT